VCTDCHDLLACCLLPAVLPLFELCPCEDTLILSHSPCQLLLVSCRWPRLLWDASLRVVRESVAGCEGGTKAPPLLCCTVPLLWAGITLAMG
jgi:hypothetical protein